MSANIYPIHESLTKARNARSGSLRPRNMTRIALKHDDRKAIESIALSIFADITNAGGTFQEALAAIYLSGLQHAKAAGE